MRWQWDMFTYMLQCLGMIVPLAGIIGILRKEQTKVSTYLLLTNIGCLIINSGYLLLIASENAREAYLAYKIEYLGNVMFYLFFLLFVSSYLGKRIHTLFLYVWVMMEGMQLAFLWTEKFNEAMIENLKFLAGPGIGIMYAQLEKGVLTEIRYAALSMILLSCMILTMIRMFKSKSKAEKANLGRLTGAEFVVLLSLVITQLFELEFDILPVAASCSIFSIIAGVIRGEFRVEDVGRTWLFEDMKDAFVVVDSTYGYLDANASAKGFFPELKAYMKGQQLSERLMLLFQDSSIEFEWNERRYSKRVVPIMEGEQIHGYSMLLADIHDQYLLMEELKQEKQRAEEANAAKSAFMSTMSHEIRTPMNAIVGMTDILLREQLSERVKEYLNNIRSSGEALLSIINDILDFSKIESGKLEIIEDEYGMSSMLNDLSMIFLNRIAEKPVELLFDIDKNLPRKLYGDGLRIRQVIINIVNNAIKFTDSGYVKLSIEILEQKENTILLQYRVKDTGQGIKEEDLGKLFGTYAQVDQKKNKYKEGTGLGLSISRQLVELMGGSISVSSVYEQGSEFVFTIPQKIVDAEPAALVKEKEAVITIGGAMRSPWAQEALLDMTEKFGLVYQDCNFTCVRNHKIDFFFTDQMNMLSDELLAKMKEMGTTLCVVQNPMVDASWDKEATVVHKPLYTMNFCQVVNRESVSFEQVTEQVMCFMAPKAEVLIVDDNEMNLKVAKGLLEPLRMKIDTAGNGKEALQMIQNKHYNLVFMDHMMPVMDGIEATRRLRELPEEYYKKLPVIALSANAVSGAKEEFVAAGMNDFVAKPIRLKEICAKLKQWLPKEYLEEGQDAAQVQSTSEAEVFEEQKEDEFSELRIAGLDIEEAILNCGTKELFVSLLGDFYKLIDMKTVKIEKCLADSMIRDLTIEVHALKNTARMIGAMELSNRFYQLEQAGNAGDETFLQYDVPNVLSLYRELKPVLKKYAAVENDKKDVDKETLIEVLLRIREAMDSFDLDGADAAMKELEEYTLPQELQDSMEELRAFVADVAMEEVMTLTEKMVEVLRASE